MEEKKYTQKDFMIEYENTRLKELGIDIEKDEYYKHPKFIELKKGYISEFKHFVTEAWWIEKNIVGQERLKKIYGIYAFGIEAELDEKELQDIALYTALADKYPEKCRNEADVRKYFNRNEHSEKNGDKLGLIARLKEWGFDIEAFPESKRERIKLLYFLYCVENENRMLLSQFLKNPTLENVDNGFIGHVTKNGDIMSEIKRTIAREINPEYIYMLNGTMLTIAQEWETQIQRVMLAVDFCDNKTKLQDLERMNEYVNIVANMVCQHPDKCGYYEDTLLETFLLKLSQHEYIGIENDILDIAEIATDIPEVTISYRPQRYIELAFETVAKDAVKLYIKENRRELAQLVFEKDKITGSDYQKFDTAAAKAEYCIDIFHANTFMRQHNNITKLLVLVIIQEIVRLDRKEIIENKFYRYERNDQKTLNTEIMNSTSAFRKNQFAWIAKVMRRYNLYKGKKKETVLAKTIEKNIDRIMIKIFNCNSLNGMICVHNYVMIWLDAVFVDSQIVLRDFNTFREKIYKRNGFNVAVNSFKAQMFFGTSVNSEIPLLLANVIIDKIEEMISLGEDEMVIKWPIGMEDNYFHEEEEFYIVTIIDIKNKEVTISDFEADPKGKYRERLITNGIPI